MLDNIFYFRKQYKNASTDRCYRWVVFIAETFRYIPLTGYWFGISSYDVKHCEHCGGTEHGKQAFALGYSTASDHLIAKVISMNPIASLPGEGKVVAKELRELQQSYLKGKV